LSERIGLGVGITPARSNQAQGQNGGGFITMVAASRAATSKGFDDQSNTWTSIVQCRIAKSVSAELNPTWIAITWLPGPILRTGLVRTLTSCIIQ